MSMRLRATTLSIISFAVFAVGANAQTVTGVIEGDVTRGKKARAVITLEIPADLHVNSNKPHSEFAIATSVKPTAKGVKFGVVEYPKGEDRKFAFSESMLNVYVGTVTFPFDITVPRTFRGKEISVNVAVRYQACNDEVCFPPKTKTVTIKAPVK
jgi:hypothetical protein